MRLFRVTSLDDARMLLGSYWRMDTLPTTLCSAADALDRVLAEDIYSKENVPPFARSTVDGYAVRADNTQAAGESSPVFLSLVGAVDMGTLPAASVTDGACVYVPTGGALPAGVDAVVMVEQCEEFPPDQIAVNHSVAVGENMVPGGEDVTEGSLLLRRGTRLRPQELGILAATGVCTVRVYEPLKVSVLSTGDELETPGTPLAPGKIYDINTYAISAKAQRLGMTVIRTAVLPDRETEIEQALRQAMEDSDIVLASGGSSQGKKDMTAALFEKLTGKDVDVHGLALKPGKPTILTHHEKSKTTLVGLPGHPAAAILVFELLVGWALRREMGMAPAPAVPARLDRNLASDAGKTTCVLCALRETEEGYCASPVLGKSGLITTLTKADGYFLIDRNREGVRKDDIVMVHLLQ